MSIFDLFSDQPDRRGHFIESAKSAAQGMQIEQLVPGALVTISASKATGDRSYCNDIWEIVAANAGTVVLKATGLLETPWRDRPAAVQIYEHEFYSAEHLAEAIKSTLAA